MRANFKATLLTSTSLLIAGTTSAAQPTHVYVYSRENSTGSKDVMMASLSGIVAKTNPEMFVSTKESMPWLHLYLRKNTDARMHTNPNPAFFVNRYKNQNLINGYIKYDADSINVATSIAGIHRGILVDETTEQIAIDAGLKLIKDVRGKDAEWVFQNYNDQLNKNLIFNQDKNKTYFLRDFAIMNNSFMFYEPPNKDKYLAAQNDHTLVYGWGSSEMEFFGSASRNNLMGVAADWLAPVAPMSKWEADWGKQRTHTKVTKESKPNKHYVAFVMSDGDNVQWLNNYFAWDTKWYGSPNRGNFTMNWDMSPEAPNINPTNFAHIYNSASTGEHKDFFVTAGGHGFTYPSKTPDIQGQMEATLKAMANVDQNVLSVLDEYETDLEKLGAMVSPEQIMGLMFKTGAAYKGNNGQLNWNNGKPILSVKYSLWDGFDTVESVTQDLNSASTDSAHDQTAYTIVNVHPWSGDPMDRMSKITAGLNDNVEMVTLEELFIHMRNNFGKPATDSNTLFAENFESKSNTNGGSGLNWHNSSNTTEDFITDPSKTHTGHTAIGFNQTTTSNPSDISTASDWISDTFSPQDADQVDWSFYYKTDSAATGSVRAQLRAFDSDGNFLGEFNIDLASSKGQWRKIQGQFDIPENTAVLDLRYSSIFLPFQGQFSLDDIRISKVIPEPATAGLVGLAACTLCRRP
ncbi:hypothetical protein JD969_19455 [Planctomycetota bacterium]|nr:hypothetical protein JD969_19455 [Planctomycetota bacterium]